MPTRGLVPPSIARARSSLRSAPGKAAMPLAGETLKIALLVRSLGYGGAERQIVTLATALHDRGHAVTVIVFYPGGPLEAELRDGGVLVRVLGKRGRWDVASFLAHLHRVLREEKPDVLYGFLAVPNIIATAMRVTSPRLKVVWGERGSKRDMSHYDWLSRCSSEMARLLSWSPDLLIVNSRAGFEHAVRRGYPRHKMVVIPNGIDTARFAPDADARRRLRREWGVGADERLIGLVGRLDPVKGHRTFLTSAASLTRERSDVRFACVGDGNPQYASELRELARTLGLGDRMSWIGADKDVAAVYNALDVLCLSSESEGFPNVLGEAMACGIPCVATDVGDSAWIIDDSRFVAPPGDAATLAECMESALTVVARDDDAMRRALRARIQANFSVENLTDRTERAIASLVQGGVG
jgi:glycosyltransferase involved in cell wall biosynthesis